MKMCTWSPAHRLPFNIRRSVDLRRQSTLQRTVGQLPDVFTAADVWRRPATSHRCIRLHYRCRPRRRCLSTQVLADRSMQQHHPRHWRRPLAAGHLLVSRTVPRSRTNRSTPAGTSRSATSGSESYTVPGWRACSRSSIGTQDHTQFIRPRHRLHASSCCSMSSRRQFNAGHTILTGPIVFAS